MKQETLQYLENLTNFLHDTSDIFMVLAQDNLYLSERINSDFNLTDLRSSVRSLFASIECQIYRQKHMAKYFNELFIITKKNYQGLTDLELLAIEERSVQITEQGKVKSANSFISFKNNFRFSY